MAMKWTTVDKEEHAHVVGRLTRAEQPQRPGRTSRTALSDDDDGKEEDVMGRDVGRTKDGSEELGDLIRLDTEFGSQFSDVFEQMNLQ